MGARRSETLGGKRAQQKGGGMSRGDLDASVDRTNYQRKGSKLNKMGRNRRIPQDQEKGHQKKFCKKREGDCRGGGSPP